MANAIACRSLAKAVPTNINLKGPTDPGRCETEQFIRRVFARVYAADVRHFLPVLMGLRDDRGTLLGALGLREATTSPLFLETYLDDSVERLLSVRLGSDVDRAGIVEVGNLAVATPGGGRWLITALTAFLHAARREWVVFTCGPALQNAFKRLGIPLFDLGSADASRLPAGEAERWGSYYQQKPRVLAGRVAQGFEQLSRSLETEYVLHALWRCATGIGKQAA